MKARIPITGTSRKAMNLEIQRQLAEYDEKNAIEIDAMVLWILHEKFGWGEKRLRKFFDCFADELKALTNRYVMNDDDAVWLCTRKLKDAGIDILQWTKESEI